MLEDNQGSQVKDRAFAELTAMREVVECLSGLEVESVKRVLDFASTHFGVHLSSAARTPTPRSAPVAPETNAAAAMGPATPLADLFAAAAPASGPQSALVVGYWMQVIGKQDDFEAKPINDALKNLGHGLSNVTTTMTALIGQRPQLVIQTFKRGRGAQTRKRYKLTQEGIRRVEEMLSGAGHQESESE